MGKQLKGLMAIQVVAILLFQNCCLWLIKMVNYLSSDNTSARNEPAQLNIFFFKYSKTFKSNGKTIKGPHGKPSCCIFFFSKNAIFG